MPANHPEGALLFMLIYLLTLVLAVVLIALAYGSSLAQFIATTPFDSPGLRVW